MPDSQDWSLIIGPRRKMFDLRLRELWRYRDLVMLFVRRDFVSVYKQTILGADRQCMSDQRMSNGTDRACLTRTGVAADSPGRSMSVTVSQMDRASA
jgi:hypothetical protein